MIFIQCLSQSLLWTMPTIDCHRHAGQKPFLIRQLNLWTYQGMSLAHILQLSYQFFGSTEGCQREDWISDHSVISLQQIYPCQALVIFCSSPSVHSRRWQVLVFPSRGICLGSAYLIRKINEFVMGWKLLFHL